MRLAEITQVVSVGRKEKTFKDYTLWHSSIWKLIHAALQTIVLFINVLDLCGSESPYLSSEAI